MKVVLETKRLYLREFIPEDGLNFFNLNNDPEVIKYTGNDPFSTLEEAEKFINDYDEYERNGFGRWAVCLKENDRFLGWCGLKKIDDEVDLGFRFFRKEWGKGYATEAALASISYGFNKYNLTTIIGRAYIENIASIRVLEKCNMDFVSEFIYDNRKSVLYQISHDTYSKN